MSKSAPEIIAAADRIANEIELVGEQDPFTADLRTLVAAVRDSQPPAETQWQPMEAAPTDHNILLVREAYADRPRSVTEGYWYEVTDEDDPHEEGWWSNDGGFTKEHPPIAWSELPSPPGPAPTKAASPHDSAGRLREDWPIDASGRPVEPEPEPVGLALELIRTGLTAAQYKDAKAALAAGASAETNEPPDCHMCENTRQVYVDDAPMPCPGCTVSETPSHE